MAGTIVREVPEQVRSAIDIEASAVLQRLFKFNLVEIVMRQTKDLGALLLLYAAASLLHFIHNAQYLTDYPGLPTSWSQSGVYLAWMGMTAIGALGWLLLRKGFEWLGLAVLAGYAALGLDSLGHYVLASFSAHTLMMNATILVEVTAAALVMIQVARMLTRKMFAPVRSR